ncbi:MAG: radical SAM protein [Armatimonadetes bacterium]|nr:radical SAM protein [Armatimonadota bacterium]
MRLATWRELKPELARRLDVLKPFDPWSSPLCTCPPKLALDVYNGCGYECLYCYVSAYNPRAWGRERVRPKKNLLTRLQRDLRRIAEREELRFLQRLPVAVSNSSDPYPAAPAAGEEKSRLTRAALELLAEGGFSLLVTTKSPLVVRDLDLLAAVPSVVAMTITTAREDVARTLEPWAPAPQERLRALGQVAEAGLPAVCRVDPLIPGVNDSPDDLAGLLDELAVRGVLRLICSAYKHKPDSFRRLERAFSHQAAKLKELLDFSERISGYYYLRREVREELLGLVQVLARERGMTMTVCREGLAQMNDGVCDARDLAG